MLYILSGLGPEFESFVTTVTTRTDVSLGVDDLQGMLINHESFLHKHQQAVGELSANLAWTGLYNNQQQNTIFRAKAEVEAIQGEILEEDITI